MLEIWNLPTVNVLLSCFACFVVNGLSIIPVGLIPTNNFKHILKIEETISEKVFIN